MNDRLFFDTSYGRGLGYKRDFAQDVQDSTNEMITSVNDLNNNTLMALDKFAVKVATLRGKIAQAVDATLTIDTLSGNSNSQFFLENQAILKSDNIDISNNSIFLSTSLKESHQIFGVDIYTNGSLGNSIDYSQKRYYNKDLITTANRLEIEKIGNGVSSTITINLNSQKICNCVEFKYYEFGVRVPSVGQIEISKDGILFEQISPDIKVFKDKIQMLFKDSSVSVLRFSISQNDGYISNSQKRFAIGISNLKVGISTSAETGSITFGPMNSANEIIKTSIACGIANDGISLENTLFEISTDNAVWEKIVPPYTISKDRKYIDYNTISDNSISTNLPVKTLYLRITMSGEKINRKYSYSSAYNKHTQTITNSYPVINAPFDIGKEYIVGENTGVDFGERVTYKVWTDKSLSTDYSTSIKEGDKYLTKKFSSMGDIYKSTVRYSNVKCRVEDEDGYRIIPPIDTDVYSAKLFKASDPVRRNMRVSDDISIVLPFNKPSGIYRLTDGTTYRDIDLSSGYFTSCYQWIYEAHDKDVRLIDPVGNVLKIYEAGKYINLLEYFEIEDIGQPDNTPNIIKINKLYPIEDLKHDEFTVVDGKVISNYPNAIIFPYTIYSTPVKFTTEFGIDSVVFKSDSISMSRYIEDMNSFDGKNIAKLNKSCIVKGSVKFDFSDASIFSFVKEVDFINGIDEFNTGNKVEVNIPKNENRFSLGHKVDHFCEIKFVGYSSIFNNRVFDSKELINAGDYMLNDISDSETEIILPDSIKTHDIISTVAIIDVGIESVGNGYFSIDYNNGIIYSQTIIDGSIKVEYIYSNIFIGGKELTYINKDEYTISGRQVSFKSPSDEMSISIISKVSESYSLDIYKSPTINDLILNTVTV